MQEKQKGKNNMVAFGLGDDKKVAKNKKSDKDLKAKDSNQDSDAAAVLAELEAKEKDSDTCAFC